MKPIQILVSFAAAAMLAAPLAPVFGQGQLSAGNGIAASPKVQQSLRDRAIASTSAVGGSTIADESCCQVACCPGGKAIAASPKLQNTLAERHAGSNCQSSKLARTATIAAVSTCVSCCNQ
jgi:hypothetical protein